MSVSVSDIEETDSEESSAESLDLSEEEFQSQRASQRSRSLSSNAAAEKTKDRKPSLLEAEATKHKKRVEKKLEDIKKNMPPPAEDLSLSRKNSLIADQEFAGKRIEKTEDMPITRICLTGGPCAGKTTALAELTLVLTQMGFRVLQVPEAATILKKGGALITTHKMTFTHAVKFQINLMKL